MSVALPEICWFLGIKIEVHWKDHPPPHVHASFGKDKAALRIDNGEVIAGSLPPKILSQVRDWLKERNGEVMAAWDNAAQMQAPSKVLPPEGMY